VPENNWTLGGTWKIEGEKRGDVIWRYNHLQADWLRNKGYIGR